HSQAPAPLLISSGYTDDLFPAGEALRYYNRTKAQYPNTPIGLFFGSFGHPRGQNKAAVVNARQVVEDAWFDYYMKGEGAQPDSNVTTYTQVCPDGDPDAGPFVTDNWVEQAPGEIRSTFDDAQTVAPDGGSRAAGSAFNPPFSSACASTSGTPETGIANYDMANAPAGGYTMMGSPTVIAKVTQADSTSSQLAFRLVDVSADGTTKSLVARTAYRSPGDGFQVIQLNANGWTVAEGHHLRLEVLPFDGGNANPAAPLSNYTRPSNDQQPATIEDLQLRIPVQEQPGALNGLVEAPAKRVLPDYAGVELAPGNEAIGSQTLEQYRKANYPVIGKIKIVKATVKGKTLTARVKCAGSYDSCAKATVKFKGAPKKGKGKGVLLASKSGVTAGAGKTVSVKFKMTSKARKLFRDSKKRKVIRKHGRKRVKIVKVKGLKSLRTKFMINGQAGGYLSVKRTGKVK
ncbi:MAG: hypothetical protein KDB54_10780, partial [Solirubrobacterales bacterium]|nr:hypothetical protein [Solirubrobacterales bacterium]